MVRVVLRRGRRALAAILLVGLWGSTMAGQRAGTPRGPGTADMARRLDAIAWEAAYANPYASSLRARSLAATTPPSALPDLLRYRSQIARWHLNAGQSHEAAATFEDILREAEGQPAVSRTFVSAVRQLLALSWLRVATQENCAQERATGRCSAPMRRSAVHPDDSAARRAIEEYTRILRDAPDESTLLGARWLLNIAYMMAGEAHND